MTSPTTELINKINSLSVLPADQLYAIHNDLRKYYQNWTAEKVLKLADTSVIENFYLLGQYLNRVIPIVGAGLVIQGQIGAGIVTAGISLYADYLITTGKDKLFKSEVKKQQLTQFKQDLTNLYDRYQELNYLLQPLLPNEELPQLTRLLTELRKELKTIAEKGELPANPNQWQTYLSHIFWSLKKDTSGQAKELILLNNGIKSLTSWNYLPATHKLWVELTRLFLSWRTGDPLWSEWIKEWERRRTEHQKIKDGVYTLQTALSWQQQGLNNEELNQNLELNLLKLEIIRTYQQLSYCGHLEQVDEEFWTENIKNQSELTKFITDLSYLSLVNATTEQELIRLKTNFLAIVNTQKKDKSQEVKETAISINEEEVQDTELIAQEIVHPKTE